MTESRCHPPLPPQHQAIQVVRTRYEQGLLPFAHCEYALHALSVAQTPAACERLVQALPSARATRLLHTPASLPVPAVATTAPQRLAGGLGARKRLPRPWRLEPPTTGSRWLGEVKLDLSL